MSKPQASEAAILERNGIALENVVKQSEIASLMEEHGYDSTEISKGKALHEEALRVSRKNKNEGDEAGEAYKIFAGIYVRLDDLYSRDRKKAKIVFREDPVTLKKLELTGTIPQAYVAWQKTVANFYSTLNAEPELIDKLKRLKITAESVAAAITLVEQIKTARAAYLKEKGESEDATKEKDAAFAKMDKWMSDFYAVARIALEDKPQLLEALGKIVKS